MKNNFIGLGVLAVILAFTSCSDDDNNMITEYTQADLVNGFKLAEGQEKGITINAGASFTAYLPGIQKGDAVVLEKEGKVMNMTWGFPIRPDGVGEDGMDYYPDSIVVKLERADGWAIGEWNLRVRRENKEELAGTVDFVLLANKDIIMDLAIDQMKISANGWAGTGEDSLVYISENGEKLRAATTSKANSYLTFETVTVALPVEQMSDGKWTLALERWEFGLQEELGIFDFVKKGFLNDDPILKDKDGKYKVYFKLDQILSSDAISIKLPSGKTTSIRLSGQDYNKETHILTLVLPDDKVEAGVYVFAMRRSGIYVLQNLRKELVL